MSKIVIGMLGMLLVVLSGCASQGDVVGTSASVSGQGAVPAQYWSNDE
jgi:hypothetical protein